MLLLQIQDERDLAIRFRFREAFDLLERIDAALIIAVMRLRHGQAYQRLRMFRLHRQRFTQEPIGDRVMATPARNVAHRKQSVHVARAILQDQPILGLGAIQFVRAQIKLCDLLGREPGLSGLGRAHLFVHRHRFDGLAGVLEQLRLCDKGLPNLRRRQWLLRRNAVLRLNRTQVLHRLVGRQLMTAGQWADAEQHCPNK